jgi:TLC domain
MELFSLLHSFSFVLCGDGISLIHSQVLFLHIYLIIVDLYNARLRRPNDAPLWLVGMYLVSNLLLNSLNLYWFSKMIDSLRRRAEVREHKDHED